MCKEYAERALEASSLHIPMWQLGNYFPLRTRIWMYVAYRKHGCFVTPENVAADLGVPLKQVTDKLREMCRADGELVRHVVTPFGESRPKESYFIRVEQTVIDDFKNKKPTPVADKPAKTAKVKEAPLPAELLTDIKEMIENYFAEINEQELSTGLLRIQADQRAAEFLAGVLGNPAFVAAASVPQSDAGVLLDNIRAHTVAATKGKWAGQSDEAVINIVRAKIRQAPITPYQPPQKKAPAEATVAAPQEVVAPTPVAAPAPAPVVQEAPVPPRKETVSIFVSYKYIPTTQQYECKNSGKVLYLSIERLGEILGGDYSNPDEFGGMGSLPLEEFAELVRTTGQDEVTKKTWK